MKCAFSLATAVIRATFCSAGKTYEFICADKYGSLTVFALSINYLVRKKNFTLTA